MAPLPSRMSVAVIRWAGRLLGRLARLGVAVLALTGPGCIGLEAFRVPTAGPPATAPTEAAALWNRNVVFSPDPTHHGDLRPGLIGRLYLYAGDKATQKAFSVAANGTVVVDLFDETPRPGALTPSQNATALEEWRFDQTALARMMRKDDYGWGYTLCLPWGTYRPDIAVVRLKVRYEPASGGGAIYALVAPITLDHSKAPASFLTSAAQAPPRSPVTMQAPQPVTTR